MATMFKVQDIGQLCSSLLCSFVHLAAGQKYPGAQKIPVWEKDKSAKPAVLGFSF